MKISVAFLVVSLLSIPSFAAWTPPTNPDPSKILQEARIDTKNKRYEDALAKHIWFHKNALLYKYSLAGVRLSFALTDWHHLGKHYPPALTKLKEIRDYAAKQIHDGNNLFQYFQEFAAINRTLSENNQTKDVFVWLDKHAPGKAQKIYPLAQPALVSEKEYNLCGKYIDSKQYFSRIVLNFSVINRLALNSEISSTQIEIGKELFIKNTSTLIALLAINGRKNEARLIANKATKELNQSLLHAEFQKALKGHFSNLKL
ncbi:MAG: hypothetical protein VST68_00540 [Nitrospirota bacterium]|nr:hypothetical protein [Nitrospirota bacterium]